uniref:SFRICE_029580 n=1 Tax=Spodoptera frugiperda TaxID=7108 RepID=A0A2H1WWN7_SPOFR
MCAMDGFPTIDTSYSRAIVNRHSKSIDITKKCCGYCHGKFELVLNKKNKDGVVVSTKAKKPNYQDFSMHVKENYSKLNDGTRTYGEVMKILAEPFL